MMITSKDGVTKVNDSFIDLCKEISSGKWSGLSSPLLKKFLPIADVGNGDIIGYISGKGVVWLKHDTHVNWIEVIYPTIAEYIIEQINRKH